MSSQLETNLVSVERVKEYSSTKTEVGNVNVYVTFILESIILRLFKIICFELNLSLVKPVQFIFSIVSIHYHKLNKRKFESNRFEIF